MSRSPTCSIDLVVAEPRHVDGLYAVLNDPEVAAWLGGPRARDAVVSATEQEQSHWQTHGFGPWVALDRVSGGVVGRGGVRRTRVQQLDEVELFYAVARNCWGRGIATEIARAALELAFLTAALPSVIAFTLPSNRSSQRVAEKTGFVREAVFEHASLPHILFRLANPTRTDR